MKKLFTTFTVITLFAINAIGQAPGTKVDLSTLKREDYIIVPDIKGVSQANRFWILFIPIGGKSTTKRQTQAYQRAIRDARCDGMFEPQYREHKIVIPLIVFTYSHRMTIVTGKGYRLKVNGRAEMAGGEFRIGAKSIFKLGAKQKCGEVVKLDLASETATFKYLDEYGDEKTRNADYSTLATITNKEYDSCIAVQNIEIAKHKFTIGEKITFTKDKKPKCGEVVSLNSKKHYATIKYLGVFAEDKTTEEEYFDIEKTSVETYNTAIAKDKAEAIKKYKFDVGEKVIWNKETLLGMKSETINVEIVSLNDLEHTAIVKFTNKDNAEKQETVSYLALAKTP